MVRCDKIVIISVYAAEVYGGIMSEGIIGIIGGSGLGDALAAHIEIEDSVKMDTPFGRPSSEIMVGKMGNKKIAFVNRHGSGHKFDPSSVPYRANIFALKSLGVTSCNASGAVGSLREEIRPGDLVIVDQVIDKTFKRQSSFFTGKAAVHCEMARPYCPRLRGSLMEAGIGIGVKIHSAGTYVSMEGPAFSTRAESLMHRMWGGDLIGMTGMPEAKLAREAQMCFALIAMPSDYDCWKEPELIRDKRTLLEEIISNLNKCTENIIKLLKSYLLMREKPFFMDCDCRKSLDLAIWTDADEVAKNCSWLDVLKK